LFSTTAYRFVQHHRLSLCSAPPLIALFSTTPALGAPPLLI